MNSLGLDPGMKGALTYSLTVTLDGLPPMNTASIAGWHWRKRQRVRKDWERRVWEAVLEAGKPPKPLESARVMITRHSAQQPDFENLCQGGKWLLDGLVKAGVLADDAPGVIGQPLYQWERAKPKQGHVVIHVEDALRVVGEG